METETRLAELDLLAACMSGHDPRNIDLTPADFDEPKHAATWAAMLHVLNTGQEIDPATVHTAMGPNHAGESVWLFDLFARAVIPSNAPAFALRVRRSADLRNIQDLARGLMQRATLDMADPAEIMAWAKDKLDTPTGTTRLTETFADTLPRVLEQIKTGKQAGLSTPWPDLDRRIHGLSADRLYVIAARPGGGKSISGQNLAWHWSRRHNLPTFFASLEMTSDEITTRTLSQVAQVKLDHYLNGDVPDEDKAHTISAATRMRDSKVHMCTDPGQTIATIRNGARQLQRREGLGLIVVDYLQIINARDEKMPRREKVDEIARGLKLMAKELHVPVVAMAQLNREGTKDKGRAPVLSDLRESGEIEQAADVVILMHIPEPAQPEVGMMYVAKARNGSTGPVEVVMRTWFASIDPMDRHHQSDRNF